MLIVEWKCYKLIVRMKIEIVNCDKDVLINRVCIVSIIYVFGLVYRF